jgi:hypothetical protein
MSGRFTFYCLRLSAFSVLIRMAGGANYMNPFARSFCIAFRS